VFEFVLMCVFVCVGAKQRKEKQTQRNAFILYGDFKRHKIVRGRESQS